MCDIFAGTLLAMDGCNFCYLEMNLICFMINESELHFLFLTNLAIDKSHDLMNLHTETVNLLYFKDSILGLAII